MPALLSRLCLAILFIAFVQPIVHAQQLKAGAALRVLTPAPLLPVSGGVGVPKPATQKQGDLFVRAFVLEKGGVRVAIVGVGNCASSLVQGVEFYRNARNDEFIPGLMHTNLGGLHVRDIEFSAAFAIAATALA